MLYLLVATLVILISGFVGFYIDAVKNIKLAPPFWWGLGGVTGVIATHIISYALY